ncbi:MAG: zf-HC2 domain-containing protein, partial [Candidatus Limnocylindrales bacterium]
MSDDARRPGSPHSWESSHDRAQALLGERFTETVDAADVAWLEEHLAGCAPCREVDAAYRADRRELRGLRVPEPPRDLWARTSAALEAERQRRPRPIAAPARAAESIAGRRSSRLTPQVLLGLTAAVLGVFLVGTMLEPSVQPPDVAVGSPLAPSGSSGLAGLAT